MQKRKSQKQKSMSNARVITRNILWNYAGMAASLAAGFLTAPFLINRLGDTTYGLWILIGSFTGYFGLLDLGVRGSVGRFIAFHRGRQDDDSVNQVLTTALALLCIPAMITVVGTLAAASLFFSMFDVPPEQALAVRMALLIVGANLALTFPASVFDGTLWGLQRFDVINAVDTVVVTVRTGLTLYLVANGHGLVALATITLVATIVAAVAKALAAYRIHKPLSIRPGHFRQGHVHELFGFGLWYFLLSVGRMFTSQLSRLLIGSGLGVALVTPFSIAASLIAYGNAFLVAGTGVLTPLATRFHARDEHEKQLRLFLQGGRICTFFGICLLGGYLCLGKAFLALWVGSDIDASFDVLVILALGELLPMSQSITGNILLAVARHKALSWITLLEAAICGVMTMALINFRGLTGPSLAVAIAAGLCRGLLFALYGCRTMQCLLRDYLRQSFVVPLVYSSPAVALLAAAVQWRTPQNWGQLLVCGACYSILCTLTGACLMKLWPANGRRLMTGNAPVAATTREA